tara:strand:+ start:290 stop:775 length:486 start_codon:yes stop_codon:yes gene_type:complete
MDVYLGLGTNQGDKLKNLKNAVNALAASCGNVICKSSVYESPPWGFIAEEVFYNSVVLIKTKLLPDELLSACQQIEIELGRKKKKELGYESRLLDIDILLYDDIVFESEYLKIPHPLINDRMFVLQPLLELLKMEDKELEGYYKTKLSLCNDKSVLKIVQT